jgi:hypothetical protein
MQEYGRVVEAAGKLITACARVAGREMTPVQAAEIRFCLNHLRRLVLDATTEKRVSPQLALWM